MALIDQIQMFKTEFVRQTRRNFLTMAMNVYCGWHAGRTKPQLRLPFNLVILIYCGLKIK